MKRLWLLFSQIVTVLLAAYFVVNTLQPQWLKRAAGPATPPPASDRPSPATPAPASDSLSPVTPPLPASDSLSPAVRQAAPAVVSINTSTRLNPAHLNDPWFRFFFGDMPEQQRSGLGSGVIMRADGYILTNHHVIEGADQIEVVLADTRRSIARVIGTDPESDLAVLKIELQQLPVISLGNSDTLQVGDRVLAIGNPFGVGQTVTSGIVSALGRNQLGINTFENFIQTDAAINPGNSGGALTDTRGRLLGINTAIYSRSGGSMGIGFAIPASTAQQVMDSIIQYGQVIRGWIGIEASELTPELAQTLGTQSPHGVMISGVLSKAPADQAGLRPGDVITHINQQSVRTMPELLSRIAALTPGQAARFDIDRRGQALHLELRPIQRQPPRQHRR